MFSRDATAERDAARAVRSEDSASRLNAHCEHFIPLRRSELIDLLCTQAELSAEDAEQFRRFCRLISAVYHFEYNRRLEELKDDYAPFDPDRDTRVLAHMSADEQQHRLNELFSDFGWLQEDAEGANCCPYRGLACQPADLNGL